MATQEERITALEQKLARVLDSYGNLRRDRINTPGALSAGTHVVWDSLLGITSAPDEPSS